MFQKKKQESVLASPRATYAVPGDFCRIFTEDQTALYLLSLALTADSEKAEQCFVTGLEDSIHGNPVFKDWARSWSKRMIIKSAIRLISPAPGQKPEQKKKEDTLRAPDRRLLNAESSGLLTAVLELAPFERFVFVMTTLEGYSIQECSILLSCTSQEVEDARTQALRLLALAAGSRPERIGAGKYGVQGAFFLEPIRAS
jgi:hypothetical protein